MSKTAVLSGIPNTEVKQGLSLHIVLDFFKQTQNPEDNSIQDHVQDSTELPLQDYYCIDPPASNQHNSQK